MGSKKRDNYYDIIKGLAILGVVTIHYIGAEYADVPTYLVREFVNLSVFVFIFLVGLFTHEESVQKDGVLAFYRKRLSRLLTPYLFWSILTVAVFRPADFLSWHAFFYRDLLLGYGVNIGYYVIVLVQLTLLTPILLRWVRARPVLLIASSAVITCFMTLLSTVTAVLAWPSLGMCMPVPYPCIFFPFWILPFVLGLFVSAHPTCRQNAAETRWKWASAGLLAAFFAVNLGESALMRHWGWKVPGQINLMRVLFSTAACWTILCWHRETTGISVLTVLGRSSFVIYLTHLQLFAILYKLLPFGVWQWMRTGHFVSYVCSMTLIAGIYLVIVLVSRKVLSERQWRWMAIA